MKWSLCPYYISIELILPTKRFFWKSKSNTYQNYLKSLQHDFVWDTFSDAMLYFLFRVKRSYRVRQGRYIWAVHRFSSVIIITYSHIDNTKE